MISSSGVNRLCAIIIVAMMFLMLPTPLVLSDTVMTQNDEDFNDETLLNVSSGSSGLNLGKNKTFIYDWTTLENDTTMSTSRDGVTSQPDHFSFGTTYIRSKIEGNFLIKNCSSVNLDAPNFIQIDQVNQDVQHTWGSSCDIYFSIDTTNIGYFNDVISLETNNGTIDFPIEITIKENSSALRLLVTDSPFDRFSSSSGYIFKSMTDVFNNNNINVSYVDDLPLFLNEYDVLLIAQGTLCFLTPEEISRILHFIASSKRVILCANYFFRGTVEKANEILIPNNLEMFDYEISGEVIITGSNIVEDNLTKGIQSIRFWRPSPIITHSATAKLLLLNPSNNTQGFIGINREKGSVIALSQSLLFSWLDQGQSYDNNMMFSKILVNDLIDIKPPLSPNALIVNPSNWTNINSFTIDWTNPSDLFGIKTGAYYYIGASPPSSQSQGIWKPNKPFTITNAPEGQNNVYVWLEDNAGNNNFHNHTSATIKFDDSPPTNLTIIIKEEYYTNSTNIILNLSAVDPIPGSAIFEMSFSNDGENWSPWECWSSFKENWNIISGYGGNDIDGEKKVFFKVKDKASNIANTISEKVLLDRAGPSVSISQPKMNEILYQSDVGISWNGTDETSGIKSYMIKIDNEEYINIGKTTTYFFNNLLPGTHTSTILAIDNANNENIISIVFTIQSIVNNPPRIISEPLIYAQVGKIYSYQVIASDNDSMDQLNFSLDVFPLYMFINNKTGLVSWTPSENQTGNNNNVIVNVTDGKDYVIQTYNITVTFKIENHPPSIVSQPSKTKIKVGETFQYQIYAHDEDGDKLSYSFLHSPKNIMIDENSGIITWTPTEKDIGSHEVSILAKDNYGGSETQTFIIFVEKGAISENIDLENIFIFLLSLVISIFVVTIIIVIAKSKKGGVKLSKIIKIYGRRAEGKTMFLWATEYYLKHWKENWILWSKNKSTLKYFENLNDVIFDEKRFPDPTKRDELTKLSVVLKKRHGLFSKSIPIIMNDISGEDFEEFTDIIISDLENAQGIILLIRPRIVGGNIDDPDFSKKHFRKWDVVFEKMLLELRKIKKINIRKFINIPIAIVFTCSDETKITNEDIEQQADYYLPKISSAKETEFKNIKFFSCSAVGYTEVKKNKLEKIPPEDPEPEGIWEIYEWIISKS